MDEGRAKVDAPACLKRAEENEAAAGCSSDPEIRDLFLKIAEQWRESGRQLERARGGALTQLGRTPS